MSVRCGRLAGMRRDARGFTLVELMVVVVIAGILAGLAFASLRKQVNAAWRAEGLSMVQSIRAAEERYRAEHMAFLNVSSAGQWYPADPRTQPGITQPFYFAALGSHVDQPAWLALRPTVPGSVRFGYLVNAGPGGTAMTTATAPGQPMSYPANGNDWYVVQAIGDTDGDKACIYMRLSSIREDVIVEDND